MMASKETHLRCDEVRNAMGRRGKYWVIVIAVAASLWPLALAFGADSFSTLIPRAERSDPLAQPTPSHPNRDLAITTYRPDHPDNRPYERRLALLVGGQEDRTHRPGALLFQAPDLLPRSPRHPINGNPPLLCWNVMSAPLFLSGLLLRVPEGRGENSPAVSCWEPGIGSAPFSVFFAFASLRDAGIIAQQFTAGIRGSDDPLFPVFASRRDARTIAQQFRS